jgi:hypothetical protein
MGGMRTRLLTLALLALVAFLPASARADGLPVIDENLAWFGASTPPVNGIRYMTFPARKSTVLAQMDTTSGQVLNSRLLPTRWSVPLVAYDLSTSGLSADGRTLVLIEPRRGFPRKNTTFTVIAAKTLRTRDTFTLQSDFSFDALSPDGRWLYLVEYVAAQDPFRYLVRLYDLQTHRLRPEPIIDPREVGDVMSGMPLTRSYSPNGRFAYTLYDGAGEHPFIHALDTVEKSARCIDLHGLMGFQRLQELKLDVSPDGGTLAVALGGEPVALVDTQTNEVTEPPPATAKTAGAGAAAEDDPRSVPWLLVAAGAAGLLLVLLVVQRLLKGGLGRRSQHPVEMLGGPGDVVDVEVGDALLDDAPHGLAEVGHEAHEPERPRVLVP